MTKEERNNKLKHLITCMKCEVSGKCCDENCPTQYDAGNMGEIIENLEEIFKILEQQPCEDTIGRQAVLNILNNADWALDDDRTVERYKELIIACYKELPSVTPTQKTGRWIFVDNAHEHARCSECGYGNVDLFNGRPHNYCPNCGAKMD